MDHLADTNVLLRSVQCDSSSYRQARSAILALLRRGDRVCIFSQNVVEFWSVAARLVATMNVNGLRSIVTFNVDDFKRYVGLQILHPQEVIAGSKP